MKKMAHVGPNMTPMVDVVMCILIFFMLGSTFLQTEMFLQSSMPAIDKAGLGTEATRLVSQLGFERMDLREIVLDVDPRNEPARRAYARVGFEQTGTFATVMCSVEAARSYHRAVVIDDGSDGPGCCCCCHSCTSRCNRSR